MGTAQFPAQSLSRDGVFAEPMLRLVSRRQSSEKSERSSSDSQQPSPTPHPPGPFPLNIDQGGQVVTFEREGGSAIRVLKLKMSEGVKCAVVELSDGVFEVMGKSEDYLPLSLDYWLSGEQILN